MTTLKLVPMQPQNINLWECQVFVRYKVGALKAIPSDRPCTETSPNKPEPAPSDPTPGDSNAG